jgi:UDP-N-acetylglucosamine 2-epimerase
MRIFSVVGARPQFVKLAPLHAAITKGHQHVIVHTGQHYDYKMSQSFFEELHIPDPDYNLNVGSGLQGAQTGKMMEELEKVFKDDKPDVVIVYGDTNTTLAGALVAAKSSLPLVHVEAGLRSYRKGMPEEINRVITDHISNLLLCPSAPSVTNLEKEGITEGVVVVGDVMTECLISIKDKLDDLIPERYGVRSGEYVLATIHRQENADSEENMCAIIGAMADYGGDVVLPLHPRTAKNLTAWGLMDLLKGMGNIKVLEPLDFLSFTAMERHAKKIMTDSGGVQKEAYFWGVPCVTVRDETEWNETLEWGWNVLTGADKDRILEAMARPRPQKDRTVVYGDSCVSSRIVSEIERMMMKGPRPRSDGP